jgi:ubiquinone biosynthesis protein
MRRKSVHRLRQIVKVFVSYGFGFLVDSKFSKDDNSPVNLRKAFEELGPTFIKIGQILSTRTDILPANYIDELSHLQDNAPIEDFNNIEQLFISEFHNTIDNSFLYFNKDPLGSASIAQVHDAILKDGRFVIVKIQRPKIAEEMHTDLTILSKILNLTKAKFTDTIIDLKSAIDELLKSTELELNFENEVNNLIKFKDLNKDVHYISTPYIVEEFCTKKIITMEKIVGLKIDDLEGLSKAGYDLDDIGKRLAISFFKQIFEDGFFHADPHPGNLIIRENQICYIDFGLMGSISVSLKNSLNKAMLSIAYGDINLLVSILMSIGVRKGHIDRNSLYEDVEYLLNNYLSTSLRNIKVSLLFQEIFDITKRNNIQLPTELTILVRSLVITEGVLSTISPDLVLINLIIPYVKSQNKNLFLSNFDFDEFLMHSFKFMRDSSIMPSKLIEFSDSVISGRAKIQLNHTNLDQPIKNLHRMVNRMVFAVIISSMIIGSSLILRTNIGPRLHDVSIIGITGFLIAALMGFYLLISILRSGTL